MFFYGRYFAFAGIPVRFTSLYPKSITHTIPRSQDIFPSSVTAFAVTPSPIGKALRAIGFSGCSTSGSKLISRNGRTTQGHNIPIPPLQFLLYQRNRNMSIYDSYILQHFFTVYLCIIATFSCIQFAHTRSCGAKRRGIYPSLSRLSSYPAVYASAAR